MKKTWIALLLVMTSLLVCACGEQPSAASSSLTEEIPEAESALSEETLTAAEAKEAEVTDSQPAEEMLETAQGETAGDQPSLSREEILQYVEEAKAKASEIEKELQGDHPQLELSFLSEDLYNVWDTELNRIWGYLSETMDKDAFDALTEEQLTWIAEKEAAVKAAGAPYEGGSIQPMIMQKEAARITRERVEELLSLVS